jgi:hypothetical protein
LFIRQESSWWTARISECKPSRTECISSFTFCMSFLRSLFTSLIVVFISSFCSLMNFFRPVNCGLTIFDSVAERFLGTGVDTVVAPLAGTVVSQLLNKLIVNSLIYS